MNDPNFGPMTYDNSELLNLPDRVKAIAKAHRDRMDRDILKASPNDMLRQAMFNKYREFIDVLTDVVTCIEHFQKYTGDMADEVGYSIINPSVTVRTYHLHNSGYRTYGTGRGYKKSEAVPPPYFFVNPTTLKP